MLFLTEWWLQQVFSETGILQPAHLGCMHMLDPTTKGFLKNIWNVKSLLYFKLYLLQRAFSYSFMGFVMQRYILGEDEIKQSVSHWQSYPRITVICSTHFPIITQRDLTFCPYKLFVSHFKT